MVISSSVGLEIIFSSSPDSKSRILRVESEFSKAVAPIVLGRFYINDVDSEGPLLRFRYFVLRAHLRFFETLCNEIFIEEQPKVRPYIKEPIKYGVQLDIYWQHLEAFFVDSKHTVNDLLETPNNRLISSAAAIACAADVSNEDSRLQAIPSFLSTYSWYWMHHFPPEVRSAAMAFPAAVIRENWDSIIEQKDSLWFSNLIRHVSGIAGPGSSYHRIFHHLHMHNNRIGVAPHQEAIVARSLLIIYRRNFMSWSSDG